MNILYLQLDEPISWLIQKELPKTIPLKTVPGWSLISPYIYPYFKTADPTRVLSATFVNNGHVFIERELYFCLPDKHSADNFFDEENTIKQRLDLLFRHLRIESRQESMRSLLSPVAISPFELKTLPKANLPKVDKKRSGMVNSRFANCAITLKQLRTADRLAAQGVVPNASDEIMIDAIRAYHQSDWTKAILYSAIAMETFVGEQIDLLFESAATASRPPQHLRLRSIRVSKNKTLLKDGVFSFLREKGKFDTMINELSDYLLRKSLKANDSELYRRATVLYKSRNRIAHDGASQSNTGLLAVDHKGAKEAIDTATAVCRWYGSKRTYPSHKVEMVPGFPATYTDAGRN